jgi:hypothetical protein
MTRHRPSYAASTRAVAAMKDALTQRTANTSRPALRLLTFERTTELAPYRARSNLLRPIVVRGDRAFVGWAKCFHLSVKYAHVAVKYLIYRDILQSAPNSDALAM